MVWLLRCGNQHHWSIPTPSTTTATLPACPVCGEISSVVSSTEGASIPSPEETLCGAPSSAAVSSPQIPLVAASDGNDETMHETFVRAPTNSAHSQAQTAKSLPSAPPSLEAIDQTLLPTPSVDQPIDQGQSSELDHTLVPPNFGMISADSHEGGETLLTEQIAPAAPTGPLPKLHGAMAQPTRAHPQPVPTQNAEQTVRADGNAPVSQGNRPKSAAHSSPLDGYEILGVLGRGGMGIVYKAKQTGLDRLVALKMVLAATHASGQERKRFMAEARAVAQLIHPNILQIYEVGEGTTGQPYFSLEYLAGGTLQEKLEKYAMPAREAAAMIEVLARGLHFAHQKNILHRDIKPANVLLTSDGIPKISDFGLAKRLDDAESLNPENAIVGTPMYMPPEQTVGNAGIGPTADIYSLGATLYEMIAGRPPFRGTTVLDTLQMVQNVEPVAPRQLQPSVPADLQTICLKCLQKDPKHRYQTAEEFANDLRNFLDGKPITARPVPAWEKAWKWSLRNPAAALLIAVSCVSLLLFAIGGVSFAIAENHRASVEAGLRQSADEQRLLAVKNGKEALDNFLKAEEQRKKADEQRELALTRRKEAQDNFQRAQRAIDVMVRLAQSHVEDERHLDTVGRQLLEKALEFYDDLMVQEPNDPLMQLQIARAQFLAGDLQEKLGRYDRAESAYGEAEKRYKALARDYPDKANEYHRDLACVYINWSIVLQVKHKDKEADAAFANAKNLLDKTANQHVRDPITQWIMAGASNNRGQLMHQRREDLLAEQAYRQGIMLFGELVKEFPANPLYAVELAKTKNNLAYLWTKPSNGSLPFDKLEEAESLYQEAIDKLTVLTATNPDLPAARKECGNAYLNRAVLQTELQWFDKAERDLVRAGNIFDELEQQHYGVADYRYLVAIQRMTLATLRMRQKAWPGALQAAGDAITRLDRLANEKPSIVDYQQNRASSYEGLANVLDKKLRTEVSVNPPLGASTVGLMGSSAGSYLAVTAVYPGRTDKTSAREWNLSARETERAWNDAVNRAVELNKKYHGNIAFAARLAETYGGIIEFHHYAANILRVTNFAEAEVHLEHIVRFRKEHLALQPQNDELQTQLGKSLCTLALLRVVRGKHAEAAQMMKEMSQIVHPRSPVYRLGVVILTRCMDAAEKSLDGEARTQTVKTYGDRAMGMLEATVNAKEGYRATLQSPDLQLLRLRPEYRARYEKLQKGE